MAQDVSRAAISRPASQKSHPDWEFMPMRIMARERARTRKEREKSKATSYTTGTGRRARIEAMAARDSLKPRDLDASITR